MALTITNVERKFFIPASNGKPAVTLPDPNPAFSVEEVMNHYSSIHPQLTTATIDGPKMTADAAHYEFKSTVGTKG